MISESTGVAGTVAGAAAVFILIFLSSLVHIAPTLGAALFVVFFGCIFVPFRARLEVERRRIDEQRERDYERRQQAGDL